MHDETMQDSECKQERMFNSRDRFAERLKGDNFFIYFNYLLLIFIKYLTQINYLVSINYCNNFVIINDRFS